MAKNKIKIRLAIPADVDAIVALGNEVWPSFPSSREKIASRIEVFPEGNYVVEHNGEIVGYTCTQFIEYDLESHPPFTWEEITDGGTLKKSHHLDNPHLYGVAITVFPRYQRSIFT